MNTPYDIEPLQSDFAKIDTEILSEFSYPCKNTFIPEDLSLKLESNQKYPD
jgi:hypothetical protein